MGKAMTHHTDAERAKFEAWCDSNEYDRVTRLDGSGYNNEKTKRAWLAWQAARRAPAEPVISETQVLAITPAHEDAQEEVIALKERIARAGVEHRRAFYEALQQEREACAKAVPLYSIPD